METKKSKYDTNPLDPDVERKAEEVWGERGGSMPTQQVGGATREVPNEEARKNVYSEAPTRRYDNPPLEAPYPSVFVPPTYAPPAQYQARQNVYQNPFNPSPSSRPVVGIGLSEKAALILPYLPFYIGVVPALLELFLVPRNEVKVRFHASQALALHIAIVIAQTLFGLINTFTGSSLGGTLFNLAALIFLIVSMVRVGRGEAHRIAPLAEPAQWFNEHIEPRKQG
jgi:uncharacterized membrane protein